MTGAKGRTGECVTQLLLSNKFILSLFKWRFRRAEYILGTSGAKLDVFEADITETDAFNVDVEGVVEIVCASA